MTGTWANMTASDLGREIDKGRIHPVELTEALLEAIEKMDKAVERVQAQFATVANWWPATAA